jgi:NAD(P)-dependent dehydrogenase (short-subunit alcohol dehydrogenase family)
MALLLLLKDKVCVIAGAASLRGIGYATAELFAAQGAKITVLDIAMNDSVADAIRRCIKGAVHVDPELHAVCCDISKSIDCKRAIDETIAKFGTVDCLINCAAVVKAQTFLSIGESDYDLMLNVNLKGAFNLSKSALDVFITKQSGVIVNVASVAAQRGGGLVGGAHYAASKGGVISMTRSIAREFGPQGIRANVVCPSMTDTGMLDGNVSDQQHREIVESIPLRRAGKARDVAGACLFLASDLAAYVTGATIDVNGGSHIH